MTNDEYNVLFHKYQLNRVAFKPLMECDNEVIRLVEAAVGAEREAIAKMFDGEENGVISSAIRARNTNAG